VVSEDLVGLHIALFVRKQNLRKIHDIATSKVKLGFSGNMGNKGATLIRFNYEDTTFCFANVHLESGHSKDLIKTRA
jgi:synaptojanin